MISKTTRVTNNTFYVDFNVKPQNIVHTRQYSGQKAYTATHIGGGTTKRQGIKEGIEIKSIKTKEGNNAWRDRGISNTITCSATSNNTSIQISVTYTLKTMGWQWKDYTGTYPFFWYGNISQITHKYRHGSFKDASPARPGSEHTICAVPSDWKLVSTAWSDWAYKHGQNTNNWEMSDGRYEKRNMNVDTSSQTDSKGWRSESGYSQITRKSMMFTFEKTYTMTVNSSGIATHPNAPTLSVAYAKGDSGSITVKHTDPAGKSATLKVNAICNGKTVEVINHSNSGSLSNNGSKTFTIDFNKHFGEAYRGKDVYYEAWSKNSLGYTSKTSSGVKGVHRYNGRPAIPTGLRIEGENGLIYNKVNFHWNKASDPDGDTVVYDVWVRTITPQGSVLKDDYIVKGLNSTSTSYSITNLPDGSTIQVWVRSSDNAIVSDWTEAVTCTKGAVPKGNIRLITPSVTGTKLYNRNPRFFFDGYDGESEFIVNINNKEFSTIHHSNLFYTNGNKVMFKPDVGLANNTSCYAYMKNQYGKGITSSTYKFTITDPWEDVTEGNIITAKSVKNIQTLIADFGKAYNKKFDYTEAKQNTIVTAQIYNECFHFLNNVAWTINNVIPNTRFDVYPQCSFVEPGQLNDDELWDRLIEDLKII